MAVQTERTDSRRTLHNTEPTAVDPLLTPRTGVKLAQHISGLGLGSFLHESAAASRDPPGREAVEESYAIPGEWTRHWRCG